MDINKFSSKQTVFFILIVVVLAIGGASFASNFSSFECLEDASVNKNNGDIAFCYPDQNKGAIVKVCNNDGTVLYTKSFDTSGGILHLSYTEDRLTVYVARQNLRVILDRTGEVISVEEEGIEFPSADLESWGKDGNTRFVTVGDVTYRYFESSIWKKCFFKQGENKLYITDEEGKSVVLFHSK